MMRPKGQAVRDRLLEIVNEFERDGRTSEDEALRLSGLGQSILAAERRGWASAHRSAATTLGQTVIEIDEDYLSRGTLKDIPAADPAKAAQETSDLLRQVLDVLDEVPRTDNCGECHEGIGQCGFCFESELDPHAPTCKLELARSAVRARLAVLTGAPRVEPPVDAAADCLGYCLGCGVLIERNKNEGAAANWCGKCAPKPERAAG